MRHDFLRKLLDLLHPVGPARRYKLQGEMFNTDSAVCPDRLDKLFRCATQSPFILRYGLLRDLDRAAAGELNLLGVAASFRGQA